MVTQMSQSQINQLQAHQQKMDRNDPQKGILALKGVNIQSIRLSQSRKKNRREIQFTPLQIQPKSLNKYGLNNEKIMRASNSSRRSSKISKKVEECRQKFPKISDDSNIQIKIEDKGQQDQIIKQSDQINSHQLSKKDILVIRKRSQITSQDGLKKINLFKVKKCTCGDCEECFKDFTYFLHIFSNDTSIPQITAKSWCIWKKNKNNKFMHYYGKRIHKVRQIASLTKIITSMTAIDYLNKYDYNPDKITYQIRKPSIMVGGTTANLEIGQIYTITQLLYALMLPSGNDAAVAISEVIGLLHNIKVRNKQVDPYKDSWYSQFLTNPNKSYSYHFINLMNEKCQRLGLLDTHFYNSHGNDAYDQLKNVSTCNQVAKISSQYMIKYEFLKSIVHTKAYTVMKYSKTWENTNKLLEDGFEGIKTGITQTAGPCLSACYKDLVVVVLNSKSMNQRWIEVKKLVRWIVRKGF